METQQSSSAIMKLTTLWALSESGLGGMMHAIKIPFTGFFLGGFAIVIITLLARHSAHPFKDILGSTLLVLSVKAAVSPHSPLPAYIAVGFQGLAGALILGLLPQKRITAALFGMTALFESAVQKFLVLTLLYGKNIWDALDKFFEHIMKDLPGPGSISFSASIITVYITVYSAWGLLVGSWAWKLPQIIAENEEAVLKQYEASGSGTALTGVGNRKKKWVRKLAGIFFICLFIASVFFFTGEKGLAVYAILRTIAALLLLLFVLNPVVKWLMARWVEKERNNRRFLSILDHLPQMRNYIAPAISIAREQHRGISVYRHFIINLLILALNAAPPTHPHKPGDI
jgi:hypothetical protein